MSVGTVVTRMADPQGLLNAEFPAKTAGECALPNGAVVWVQTLNSLHREDCQVKANKVASLECADLGHGGKMRAAVIASVKNRSADEQASMLAMDAFRDGSMVRLVDEKFPVLPQPEHIEGEDEAGWLERYQAWEASVEERGKARYAYEDELWEAEKAKHAQLTAKERVERCVRSYVSGEWVKAFLRQVRVEQLLRAVRRVDDHRSRYFESVEEIEDLDDPSLQALLDYYDELVVNLDAVPT